jgi:hypothetical protein
VIGANAWVIHRQPEIFGNDCEVFRPERWLEGDRSQMGMYPCQVDNTKLTRQIAISSHSEAALGHALEGVSSVVYGRRFLRRAQLTLIDLSWIEITKVVPSLLMRFDIELAEPDAEPKQRCW